MSQSKSKKKPLTREEYGEELERQRGGIGRKPTKRQVDEAYERYKEEHGEPDEAKPKKARPKRAKPKRAKPKAKKGSVAIRFGAPPAPKLSAPKPPGSGGAPKPPKVGGAPKAPRIGR